MVYFRSLNEVKLLVQFIHFHCIFMKLFQFEKDLESLLVSNHMWTLATIFEHGCHNVIWLTIVEHGRPHIVSHN